MRQDAVQTKHGVVVASSYLHNLANKSSLSGRIVPLQREVVLVEIVHGGGREAHAIFRSLKDAVMLVYTQTFLRLYTKNKTNIKYNLYTLLVIKSEQTKKSLYKIEG